MSDFFPGFDEWDLPVAPGVTLHGRSGGAGPAVLLLHGHPRTHATWYRVAPALAAEGFHVVCPDLRGYGRSAKPEPDPEHLVYCDRTMAADLTALMTALGHERFAVVGHDRGCYVAYRTALDAPERVTALAACDGIPLVEAVERADAAFAADWWHWFFFASSPHAERVITADPLAWYRPDESTMGTGNYEDMVAAVTDPRTVVAMLEDYRAGLTVDPANDAADREAGHRIAVPTLVMWSCPDEMARLYGDPAAIWKPWCEGPVRTAVIDSGHHMAEEAPGEVAAALTAFLGGR